MDFDKFKDFCFKAMDKVIEEGNRLVQNKEDQVRRLEMKSNRTEQEEKLLLHLQNELQDFYNSQNR